MLRKLTKLFILLLCVALLWTVSSQLELPAMAVSGSCGYNCTWTLDNQGQLTISGSGPMYDFTWRGSPWYQYHQTIKTVIIPEGVTSIGDYAFSNCSSLQSITIPEGVTSIGDYAFYDCSSLQSITILEGVTSIGDYAFYNCSSLQSITIPEGVTSIGKYAFCYCSSLQSITIPEGVTSIGAYAFLSCSSLQDVYISDLRAWLSIEFEDGSSTPMCYADNLYLNNALLTDVTIPEGVTSIGDYAFSNCSSLQSITIPEGVTSIGDSAFYNCRSLQSITIPEGVTSIGDSAFSGCSSLQSITIPEGVTSIGMSAFSNCRSLQSITIPEGVTSIGDYAFRYCSSLQSITIPEGVTSIGDYAFYDCSSLQSITIPEGVTSIGDYAFSCCSSLQSITIPESVTSMGDYAFRYCYSLEIIQFLGSAPKSVGSYSFSVVTADVYTLCTDASWTENVKSQLGGNLTWKGHLYVDCVYNEDATCTKNGTQTGMCQGCGKRGTMVALNTAGHRFGDYVYNNNATCTQDGTQTRSCSGCGRTETTTIPGSATGHRFGIDGICATCGLPRQIFINLTDSYGDGWSGCAIEVYGDDTLLTTATISSGSSKRVTLAYNPSLTYTFRWSAGSFSNECGFEILLEEELLFSGMGDEYFDGDVIYTLLPPASGVTLSGSITDFGVGDATLTLATVDGTVVETVTTASGSYSITAAPGEYILTVSKENHVTRQYAVTLDAEAVTLDVKIHLIGDVDGNGKVNVGDISKINAHLKGTTVATDEYWLLCANVNGGKLNMGDTAALYSHIRGTKLLY